jgi:hypothetical protein
VVVLGVSGVPFGQEIIFVISTGVICYMLVLVTAELDHNTRMGILFATIIVFAFRAAPTVGDGYFWWTLDKLNFDAAFYGTLRQTGAILSIAVMWIFSRQLTESSIAKTLFWIAVANNRATWFALMASLMNIAVVASQLQTKYLNEIFVVRRGQYAELGPLLVWAVALSFIIPVGAIVLFGKRTVRHVALRH